MDLLQIQGSTVFKLEYKLNMYIYIFFWVGRDSNLVRDRDGSLEDRGRARDLILMASVLVSATHVAVSEVPASTTTLIDSHLWYLTMGPAMKHWQCVIDFEVVYVSRLTRRKQKSSKAEVLVWDANVCAKFWAVILLYLHQTIFIRVARY